VSEDKKTIVKMAHIYSQEGRWDKAIAEYKKLIKLDPEDYNSYSMIGDVYVKKAELQPAFDAYLVCSDAYIRLGQLEKAGLVQSKIARLDSAQLNDASKKKQSVFIKQVEGDKAMEAGEIDSAAAAYQAVLEMDPDRFDLYQKLGDLFIRKGDTASAVKKYLEIGDIYFRNKLIKKAAPIYLKVVELDPENVDAYAALADIHVKSGNETEAKRELLQLTELLFLRGDYDRCFLFAQKGEQLKSIESYNYLGHVELKRGKVAEAKAWFEKLLKFKLNHGGALWGMGLVHLTSGNDAEALKAFEKVPKADRFYGEARYDAAEIYAKQGKSAEAGAAFQEAATLLRGKGLEEQAKKAVERAGQLGAGVPLSPAEPVAAVPAPEAPAPAPVIPPPVVEAAAPASAPEPAAPTAPPALPPLPTVAAAPTAALPPLPVVATPFQAPAEEPESAAGDDAETLLGLAENFEAEAAYDEAIGLYQRVLAQDASNVRAKEALGRVYGALARGAMGGVAPAQDDSAAKAAAEAEAARQAKEAEELKRLAEERAKAEAAQAKAEEDAKRQAEELAKAQAEAKRLAEERAKAEEEAKRQIEQKIADAAAQAKAEAEAKLRAETEAKLRAEIEAHLKAQAEAKRQAEEAAKQSEMMKKQLEAEIRAQLEAEMRKKVEEEARRKADEEVALKVLEAKRLAEAEARAKAEEEIRRQLEAEKKKLENEKAEVTRQLEEQMRARITAEVQKKETEAATLKVEAVRQKSEDEARKKIQADVLARVQAQQKEKLAPLQRTIEEIRRKVEEQQAAQQPAAAAAPAAKPAPAPAAEPEGGDDMDDFMTAAVADIYVKQGLVKEAQRIYERILKREPGNADVRAKLEALTGAKSGEAPKPVPPLDPTKKSKVSYL
jgi:tetratricopeptide (TPR) repeat protein